MRSKANPGFSLVEVLIAVGVVATGLLALMAVFTTGTRSNQHGRDLTRATYYARKITELIRENNLAFATGAIPPTAASGINDPVGTFRPLDSPPVVLSNIRMPKFGPDGLPETVGGVAIPDPDDLKFERNIRIERASTVPTDYNFSILRMTVTVRWQGGKSGDGMRRTKVESLLKGGA